MFLDESGDHSLTKIDPQYPVFVLGGVIVDVDYAKGAMERRIREFKWDHFGNEDLVLHTADIIRNKNGYEALKDQTTRARFFVDLNTMMRDLDYKVVACAIRKTQHLARYGLSAVDPYMLALELLAERFIFEVEDSHTTGLIVAEKRGHPLDQQLDLAWLSLQVRGTGYLNGAKVAAAVSDLVHRPKNANIAGLQMADLVVSCIGRHVLGKPAREDWQIVESKFRRDRFGQYRGRGLMILPP